MRSKLVKAKVPPEPEELILVNGKVEESRPVDEEPEFAPVSHGRPCISPEREHLLSIFDKPTHSVHFILCYYVSFRGH